VNGGKRAAAPLMLLHAVPPRDNLIGIAN